MPMCGFNNQMLKGLEMFHKGLVDNKTKDKSNDNLGELEKTNPKQKL